MSNFRITEGVSRYPSSFTPPTDDFPAPPVPYPPLVTALLMHMDGTNGSTVFTDSSINANPFTAFNVASISTTDPKFGSGCGAFNGGRVTGNVYGLGLSTGDFTVEMFVKPAALGGYTAIMQLESSTGNYIYIGMNTGSGRPFQYDNGTVLESSVPFTVGVWQHWALVRKSGVNTMYLNGTQVATAAWTKDLGVAATVTVGGTSGNTQYYNGAVDELRITKGVALYTANFTPPSAPFPNPT
jgi:hypothetical protein